MRGPLSKPKTDSACRPRSPYWHNQGELTGVGLEQVDSSVPPIEGFDSLADWRQAQFGISKLHKNGPFRRAASLPVGKNA